MNHDSSNKTGRVLTLTAPRELELVQRELPAVGPDSIRLGSIASAISHGTELNLYRGTSPFDTMRFDEELRTFVPADASTAYPLEMGYEMVSTVLEVGDEVTGFVVGDLVQSRTPHQDQAVVEPEKLRVDGRPLVVLPTQDGLERGLFVSLSSVALQAVHDARVKLGDQVAVFGMGVIGLLVVQLARLNGARTVVAVDPVASRRELAERLGATHSVDPTGDLPGLEIKQRLTGRGVDAAIETSGSSAGIHGAVAATAIRGRVVTVGFYRGGAANLRLGEEWHHNAPVMVSSMSGWGCPLPDHPRWDPERLTQTAVDLLFEGALDVEPLLGNDIDFDDAPSAYARLDTDPAGALKTIIRYPGQVG